MEDNTNLTEEMDDELDLDLEDAEEAGEEENPAEEQETDETDAPAEDATETEPAGTIRVKFNGEDKRLTREEAAPYIQKGMNYDKVRTRLETLEKNGAPEALALAESMAAELNMSVPAYLAYAAENLIASSTAAQLQKIMKENPDLPESVAKELARTRAEKKAAQFKAAKEAKTQKPWEELAEEYPDIKSAEDLPQGVRDAIKAGKPPLLAMREHEIAELRATVDKLEKAGKAKEKNEKNKQAALGSAKGTSKQNPDPVLAVLLADDDY